MGWFFSDNDGLTSRQREILSLLSRRSEWTIAEIAEATAMSSSATTRAIARLEERHYLQRGTSSHDRRTVVVRVTSRGLQALRE